MRTPTLWKITCQEDEFPGLWQKWFRHQCVAVGYPPKWLRDMERRKTAEWKSRRIGWHQVCNRLEEMRNRDLIVVALQGSRIGRLGEVIEKRVKDGQWDPTVDPSPDEPEGLLGRRILVRWDLNNSPDSPDLIVQLPEGFELNPGEWRPSLARVHRKSAIEEFKEVMADPKNWVKLLGQFSYERALSDYIAHHPQSLEAGLSPYPGEQIRERIFKDRSRADVLLRAKDGNPVIVECKQESPTVENIRQLRGYMKRAKEVTTKRARGILVHGGALKVDKKAWLEAKSHGVRIFQYKLDVVFAPSCV